jgi:hypothetical protein
MKNEQKNNENPKKKRKKQKEKKSHVEEEERRNQVRGMETALKNGTETIKCLILHAYSYG